MSLNNPPPATIIQTTIQANTSDTATSSLHSTTEVSNAPSLVESTPLITRSLLNYPTIESSLLQSVENRTSLLKKSLQESDLLSQLGEEVNFKRKQAKNLVDPSKAVKIVKKLLNLSSKATALKDLSLDNLLAAKPSKVASYKRKLKMEDPYHQRVWAYPYPIPYVKLRLNKGYDNHNMPPSKVVHCRAVADGCKETDLVQVMRPFGNIKALTLMPKLRQALVEFEDVESAITCVSFASQLQPILVLGRQMYVNYSKSTEINRDFSSSASVGQTPTNILLFTIINAIHPVNVETVKKISQQHAEVQRIVIFHKNGLQALVEFLTIDDAQNVQQALNGCDIFAGCCTLKIDFSKTGRLNVHANTTETYDVEIEKRKRGGSLLALMNHSIEAGSHSASSKSSTPMDFPLKDPSPIGTGSLSAYTSALQAPMQPTTQSSMTGSSSMTSLSSQTQESRQPPNLSALHSMNEVFSNLSQQKPPSPPHQPPTPTQPTVPGIDTSKLNQEAITALLAGAAGFPAVQSIIAKVMAPNPSSSSIASHTNSQYSSGLNNLLTSSMDSSADSDSGSSSMSSGINRTTLLTGMPNSMDSFSSPFAALGGGLSMAGGEGCVAMVYGVNSERMNCDHLFNLFCLYGNVVKVKTLVNKPGAAMIQYTDKMSTDISIRNLNNLTLFGQKFQLSFSKHPFIADASQVTPLFDGSPSAVSYADSRNNRFKYIPGGVDIFSRIHPPSKVLHYFNAPPDCSEDHLKQVFHSLGAEIPIKQATFSKSNGKSSSGLLEFSSVPTAVEALILANHFTMQRDIRIEDPFQMLDKGGAAYTLKLAFSPSNAINN